MACCGGSSVKNDKFSTFSDACYTANIDKMKEELKKNAKNRDKLINERNEDGFTPLHRAAQRGNPDVIAFLLEQRADVTTVNKSGESPLHIACFHRKKAAVERLLKTNANKVINLQDHQHGMTALHVAIYRGSPEIAELLLKAGADPSIKDKYGNDAVELAKFWVGQAEAGLSSPTAKHHQTLEVLKQRVGGSVDADATPATTNHEGSPPSSVPSPTTPPEKVEQKKDSATTASSAAAPTQKPLSDAAHDNNNSAAPVQPAAAPVPAA